METARGYHRDSRIKQMTLLNLAHSPRSLLRFHSFRHTSSQPQVIRSFSIPCLLDIPSLLFRLIHPFFQRLSSSLLSPSPVLYLLGKHGSGPVIPTLPNFFFRLPISHFSTSPSFFLLPLFPRIYLLQHPPYLQSFNYLFLSDLPAKSSVTSFLSFLSLSPTQLFSYPILSSPFPTHSVIDSLSLSGQASARIFSLFNRVRVYIGFTPTGRSAAVIMRAHARVDTRFSSGCHEPRADSLQTYVRERFSRLLRLSAHLCSLSAQTRADTHSTPARLHRIVCLHLSFATHEETFTLRARSPTSLHASQYYLFFPPQARSLPKLLSTPMLLFVFPSRVRLAFLAGQFSRRL